MSSNLRLTWYPGSILPYASLWHTVLRVASLNCLRVRDLPVPLWRQHERRAHLPSVMEALFNEWNGQQRVALPIDAWAASLGESSEALAWSHLGAIPQWARPMVVPGFRICCQCVAAGYHSALLSIRLLQTCPIHGTELVSRCACGRPFASRFTDQTLSRAGHCACGKLSFFTRETCRMPVLSADQTRAFRPLVEWLEALSRARRPRAHSFAEGQRNWHHWVHSLAQWEQALGIEHPDCLVTPQPQVRLHAVIHTHADPRSTNAVPGKRFESEETPVFTFRQPEPQHWVYRAMQRHLRRHVIRNGPYWVEQFKTLCDPIEIAKRLRESRSALLAFADMQWARTIEPDVIRRRWPYRADMTTGEPRFRSHLTLNGTVADTGHQPLSRRQREWLAYHVSGALLSAAWRRAVTHAVDCARSGVADWTVIAPLNSPSENWTLHQADTGLHFLHLAQHPFTDWALPASDKATRRARAQAQASEHRQRMLTTCSGACLTWCERDGWHVSPAWAPVDGTFHRHRLLGFPGERPLLWLFEAQGGFVARLQDMALQTWAQTPKAAIDALRTSLRRHRLTYGRIVTFPWPHNTAPVATSDHIGPQRHPYYEALVRDSRSRSRFWEASRELGVMAQSSHLMPDG